MRGLADVGAPGAKVDPAREGGAARILRGARRLWLCVLTAAIAVLGLGPPAAAATTVAYVQGTVFGTGTQVTSTQAKLTGAVGAGDLLVGWFSQYNAAGSVQVSDNVNGAWTRAPASEPFGSSSGDNALYYVQNTAGSAAGLTVTVSASTATYLQGTLAEYSGMATAGALDQSAVGKGAGTAVSTSATAPVGAGELVFSALVTGGSPNGATPGTSQGVAYTARAKTGSSSVFSQDILSAAAGSQVGSATLGASTNWYAVVATFRPAAATAPSAPTGLTATTTTSSQVALSWTAPSDNTAVTGYTVYRNGTQIGSSTTTGFTDATVAASTTYSYTVSATNSAGQSSAQSAPLSVTTPAPNAPAPPAAPTGLTPGSVTATQVVLGWTASASSGVTGYTVYRNGTQIGSSTTTGFTDATVAASTTYSYTVSATDSTGQTSAQSAPLSVTTPATAQPPSTPAGLTAASVTSSQVTLSWTASTGNTAVTGYTVYRNGTQIGSSTMTGYTDATVAASTTYAYTVSATDSAGQSSAQSDPLSVTTSPSTQGPCSATGLASAISTANAVTGTGTVTLTAGCTYTLTASGTAPDGPTGLPAITGTVVIEGNGATITRSTAAGTPHFRILDVAVGGQLTLRNVTLSNGIADDGVNGGGGIYNHGTLAVTGATFSSNSSPATTGTSGAAISNAGTLTVSRSTFTGGTAQEGGGVFNQATATITQSTFTNNTATIYGGGAILNAYGTTTVSGSTFIGNSGPGGGVIDNDTTINISDSTFYDNTAGTHGGGAIQNFGTVNLTTSTLSGNSSPYGANIYNYGSSQITVSSTVVADGKSGSNCGGSPVIDGGYNIDSTAACGFSAAKKSASNTAPLLQAPAANGGPTMTMALTPGSPAIDAIPASTPGCTGTTDQRGVARPQGASCDVGAYEQLYTGSDTQPPTVPSGLAAGSAAAGAVTFSWSPSTDNVGVAGYTVYRDGAVIGTSGGSVPSYTDATAAPSTTYRYAVDAYDAAGNHSALSAELSVTTGSASAPPPQRVQGNAATTGSKVAALTIPLTAPVAAGDLLVGWFGQYDATGQVQVSDNVNGVWTRAPASTTFGGGTGHGDIALYYVQNSAAAAGGITITVKAGAATYLQGVVAEYSGVARTGALNASAAGKGTGTAADTATTAAVNAGELVFGGLLTGGSPGTVTAGGGLTLRDHNGSFSADDGDGITVAGAQHAPWTLTSSTDWYAGVAVFHTAAGA